MRRINVHHQQIGPKFLDQLYRFDAVAPAGNNVDIVARGRDGVEAIELVEKFRPDLLVMDIDTPHLDGLNAALIISTRFPSTEIILMSTEDSRELRADCSAC